MTDFLDTLPAARPAGAVSVAPLPLAVLADPDLGVRRRRRERAAALTGGAAILNKLASASLRLLTVPLALRALGPERYGMWMAVGSLLSWLSLFDFGAGNGLVNPLSRAHVAGDRAGIGKLVSSALCLCAATAALIAAAVQIAVRYGVLPPLLGIAGNPALAVEASHVALAAGWVSAGSFLLSFVAPFCFSAQSGYLSSIVSLAGTCAGAAAIVAVAAFRPSTVAFVLAASIPPLVATLSLAVYLFSGPWSDIRPSAAQFSPGALAAIARCGAPLLVMQVANLAAMQSANLLIAHRFGLAAVPRYSVPYAMFTTGAALCYALTSPFWPAYSEALAGGDLPWIAGNLRQTLARTLGFMGPACLAAALFGRAVIRLWAGQAAVPSPLLIVSMSVYFFLAVWSMNYSIVLLAMGALRVKAALGVLVALTHIGGFYLLSPALGAASLPLGGGIGVLAEVLVGRALYRRLQKSPHRSSHAESRDRHSCL